MKRRVSGFDLFFAAVAIAVSLAVGLHLVRGGDAGAVPTEAVVTVKVCAITPALADRIAAEEDFAFDGIGGARRIRPARLEAARVRHLCPDGVVRMLPAPQTLDAVLLFRCEGTRESDGFFLAGNLWLGVNQTVRLRCNGAECRGRIVRIDG